MIYIVALIIYSILALCWAIFAVYKTRQFGTLGKLFSNQLQSFFLNLIIFPYAFYYAIKHKKL